MSAYKNIPLAEYLAENGINSTAVRMFRQSPSHLRDYWDGKIEDDQTEAMLEGTVLHALVLENKREYVVEPDTYPAPKYHEKVKKGILKEGDPLEWNNNSTICSTWTEAQTLPIISEKQEAQLNARAKAILECPPAIALLNRADNQKEVSIFATDPETGLRLKARPDCLSIAGKSIADIKSCRNASTRAFGREILSRGYHIQSAINLYVCKLNGIDVQDFHIIAIEKGTVPRVNCKPLKPEAIELGHAELMRALRGIKECQASGKWPGYCEDGVEHFNVPAYATEDFYNDGEPLTLGGEEI